MTEIYIPKSLKECAGVYTYEYTGPFYECTNLKTVHFEEGLTEIADSLFLGCPGIEEIVIPETVTVIEGNAFQYARNLKNEMQAKTAPKSAMGSVAVE